VSFIGHLAQIHTAWKGIRAVTAERYFKSMLSLLLKQWLFDNVTTVLSL